MIIPRNLLVLSQTSFKQGQLAWKIPLKPYAGGNGIVTHALRDSGMQATRQMMPRWAEVLPLALEINQ